ncbi:MAG: bis(5'-nucleosyl)-tetraphosphatase (symmetrical) YqeK [Oscillospiraceae bacterium]|nr:bis(5'-nucleosyl)-tetraphosphatase (symmetrical) YqeK [Oscillospiraceae bacterium]
MDTRISKFYELAEKTLSERRFIHSKNVANSAALLAKKYGEDPLKAETAGILHDITKELNPEKQLQIMRSGGIILDDILEKTPKLYHAVSGMVYARDTLGITDEGILNAIRTHTTGAANMPLLSKIIFIADFISEERDYPDVDIMRRESEKSLEDGMRYALKYVISDLLQKGRTVHPDALAAYNEVVLDLNK